LALVTRQLLDAGLLHEDVLTVAGQGLGRYTHEPFLQDGALVWRDGAAESLDLDMVRPVSDPFDAEGGLRLLKGNLGRAIIKTSAVKPQHRIVEAPAEVFDDQADFLAAFKAGALDKDFVAVVRFQGPKANGMPELHSLSPALGVLQDRGRKVALVTDGRMSGASGKTPAAIHLTPEAVDGGPIARIRTGDIVRLDAERGTLQVQVTDADLMARPAATAPPGHAFGMGRDLFGHMRQAANGAEHGATALFN
jgi:phosphogluconate dehydratase